MVICWGIFLQLPNGTILFVVWVGEKEQIVWRPSNYVYTLRRKTEQKVYRMCHCCTKMEDKYRQLLWSPFWKLEGPGHLQSSGCPSVCPSHFFLCVGIENKIFAQRGVLRYGKTVDIPSTEQYQRALVNLLTCPDFGAKIYYTILGEDTTGWCQRWHLKPGWRKYISIFSTKTVNLRKYAVLPAY